MKILFVNTLYFPDEVGGAERSVRFLAEAVVALGHQAIVLSLGHEDRTDEKNGVILEYRRINNLYHPFKGESHENRARKLVWHCVDSFNWVAMKNIGSIVAKHSPDLIHTNNVSGFSVSVWSVAQQNKIPVVHTLRDYYLLCPRASMFKAGNSCPPARCVDCRIFSFPRKASSANVQFVIGNSQYILNEHVERGYFPNAKKAVIFNAYESNVNVVPPLQRPSDPVFGYIGRLDQTKGLEYLIKSFAQYAEERGARAKLLIAGEGDSEYVSHLKALAGSANIEFLGRVNPAGFYSVIHYTILPALWAEPLARVIFESFVHGVPLIATSTGGTPELVINDKTGYLVPPNNLSDLSRIMGEVEYSGGKYENMIKECLDIAPEFKYSNVASKYLEVYASATK